MKPKLLISFSGGRTSAVMTKMLWDYHKDTHDIRITFANTGCEHPATLDFVHECETHFNWPVVWLETVVNPERGQGVKHKIVNYETASRNGEPFEEVVKKYGIFNMTSPACTARLKTDVMESYVKSQGFIRGKKRNYFTAIGIRADEMDRVSARREELGFIYPLVDWEMTKRDIALEIKKWSFDLQIPNDAYGNCVWCWKKTMRKHLTLAKQDPSIFDFPKRMEEEYSHVNGHTKAAHEGRRYWFRKHLTVDDIIATSRDTEFTEYVDDPYEHGIDFDPALDTGSACGESCEIGADE
jgi:3'-phosphoadenosine 5'-phosphosulfate sulfotransferase (PAPS reductase)/FAD synthetase